MESSTYPALLGLLGLSWLLSTTGCVAEDDPGEQMLGRTMPDFSLPDTNTSSPRAGQMVSPGDYLGTTSAWYFGHAT